MQTRLKRSIGKLENLSCKITEGSLSPNFILYELNDVLNQLDKVQDELKDYTYNGR